MTDREPMDADLYGERGELFFHYTSADAAFGYILPDGQMRFRPYSLMRDPVEAKDWRFVIDGAEPEPASLTDQGVQGALHIVRRQARILSLTIDADLGGTNEHFGRGYARARMWEHYADNHAGVCLCFTQDLKRNVRSHLDGDLLRAGAVRYTPGGFASSPARRIDGIQFEQTLERVMQEERNNTDASSVEEDILERATDRVVEWVSDRLSEHVTRHVDDLFFLKTSDWESEHEYRLAVFGKTSDIPQDFLVPYGNCLRAVILGERFPTWQLPAAEAACERQAVDLLRMEWTGGIPTPVAHAAPQFR